jgi:hypothetical protein
MELFLFELCSFYRVNFDALNFVEDTQLNRDKNRDDRYSIENEL